MPKCNNCWCEHYDKNDDNCDKCLKKEMEEDNPELGVILKRRAVREMELDKGSKIVGQKRGLLK